MPRIPGDKIDECITIGRYPYLFSTPIFFFDPLTRITNNGTLTLIQSSAGIIGITCYHIIGQYLEERQTNKNLIFRIGDNIVDPVNILIDYNRELDIATLRIHKSMLPNMRGKTDPIMGSQQISSIYNQDVKVGDRIFLGGFPGSWVETVSPHFKFETFSIGLHSVQSAGTHHFTSQLDGFNNWLVQETVYKDDRPIKSLLKPGGLSGGPVFIEVKSDSGFAHFELAGIIYEGGFPMDSTSLVLFIRPAKFILPSGKIQIDFSLYCSTKSNCSAQIVEGFLDNVPQ